MKKILLSVIALFAAVSMNAQTAVNDDPSYFNLDKSSGWGGHWFDLKDADGNLNYDASAYEYAWIKFSGNTGKFRFGLTYSEWKSTEAWGETYFDAMNVITEGGEEGGEKPAATGDFSVISINVENAMGLDKDNGTSVEAGTVLFDEEEGTLKIGDTDTYKPADITALVNNEPLKGGLQGGTNPKDADGGFCWQTLKEPATGAFFVFEAKKDGYLYLVHKASSNKAYTVFEEGTAIGYKFAAQGDATTDLGAVYQFELKGEGEYNEVKEPVLFAEQEFLKGTDKYDAHVNAEGAWDPIKVNGLGVIVFPVVKDCIYKFNANGSKMSLAGVVFSAADDLTIATADGVEIYKGGGETAIQGAKVVTVAGNSAIYNLAGQKVNASYKGIVIKDGKKYIQK